MFQQFLTKPVEKQGLAAPSSRPVPARLTRGKLPPPILQLQRILGNQRVAQLIQAKRLTSQGKIIGLQPKLTVGAADDQYEQEADRVARQVMSMPDAAPAHAIQPDISEEKEKDKALHTKPLAASLAHSITPFAQRQVENNEEPEEKKTAVQAKPGEGNMGLQRQPEMEEEETEPIQAKSAGSLADSLEAGDDVENQLNQSKGGGSPLPDAVRGFMEPRFGVDFSQVRAHTGSKAIQMNRDVGAKAFTHSSDIYYGPGQIPGNLELTAHELVHTIQQSPGMKRQVLNLQSVQSERYSGTQGSGIVQRKLRKRDEKIKAKFDQLIMDGKHDEALKLICKKYGFKGKNFEIKLVPAMADNWATTGGEIKAGAKQTLSIGKDLLDQDFVFVVRTIGHEFQHLKQRSQKKPIENQKEREFLAWSWEALDKSVPSYSLSVAAEHAKTALEFYDAMPDERKKLAGNKRKKKALDKLIKKAEAAATP